MTTLPEDRLNTFIKNLPLTNIQFIYFRTSQFFPSIHGVAAPILPNETPYIKSNTYLFETNKINNKQNKFYMIPGIHKNSCYVFSENSIKYVVSNYNNITDKVIGFVKNSSGNINHGSHFTFTFLHRKNLILSHKTEYSDDMASPGLIRVQYNCNFEIDANDFQNKQIDPNIKNFNDFKNKTCKLNSSNVNPQSINLRLTDEVDQFILYVLTNVILNNIVCNLTYGGKKIKQYSIYKNRKYLVRYTNKNKAYIISKNKKKFNFNKIKKGGNLILDDGLIQFIYDTFILAIVEKSEIIESIYLFYDPLNEIVSETDSSNNDSFTLFVNSGDTDYSENKKNHTYIFRNDMKFVYSVYLLQKSVEPLSNNEVEIVNKFKQMINNLKEIKVF